MTKTNNKKTPKKGTDVKQKFQKVGVAWKHKAGLNIVLDEELPKNIPKNKYGKIQINLFDSKFAGMTSKDGKAFPDYTAFVEKPVEETA